MAPTITPGYNRDTNAYVVVDTEHKPAAGIILKEMFHSKTFKLRQLAKMTGMRPAKVFKAMYDRNTAESDALADQVTNIGDQAWSLGLTPPTLDEVVMPDVARPAIVVAEANGTVLTVTFDDVNHLDTNKVPSANKFTVMVNDRRINVSKVQLTKNSNILKLILSNTIKFGDVISVDYAKPDQLNNQLQDTAKNIVDPFTISVVNSMADPNPQPAAPTVVAGEPDPQAPAGDQTPPVEEPNPNLP